MSLYPRDIAEDVINLCDLLEQRRDEVNKAIANEVRKREALRNAERDLAKCEIAVIYELEITSDGTKGPLAPFAKSRSQKAYANALQHHVNLAYEGNAELRDCLFSVDAARRAHENAVAELDQIRNKYNSTRYALDAKRELVHSFVV